MSPFVSIITPEPICSPCVVVTSSSTTAGSIFAIAASCRVSIVEPLDEVVVVVTADLVVVAVLLVLPVLLPAYSNPANSPTPKIMASTSVKSRIAPPRPCRFCGGSGAFGPGGIKGNGDVSCSAGACVAVASSKTATDSNGPC